MQSGYDSETFLDSFRKTRLLAVGVVCGGSGACGFDIGHKALCPISRQSQANPGILLVWLMLEGILKVVVRAY